jgi:phosphoribosyl 1,2-cyclic phosphodiesterase
MRFSVLGSGSKGNAVFIESGKTGILIDAGFSGKELARRLHLVGQDLANIKGICVTHEHNDHIRGAGVLSRRRKIPVHANEATLTVLLSQVGKIVDEQAISNGRPFAIGDLEIRSFSLSHDCVDPVGYIVSDGKSSLGYCTDTGRISHLMAQRLAGCDALILEFNHNLDMLKTGPYPVVLQQRVRSSQGHLSNDDASKFLYQLLDGPLHTVVLAHLSEVNNTPELAMTAARKAVEQREGDDFRLILAKQDQPTEFVVV